MGLLQAFQVPLIHIKLYKPNKSNYQCILNKNGAWMSHAHTNSLQDSLKKSSLSSYKIFYNSNGDYIKIVIFLETQLEFLKLVHHVSNIFETS
jgi:hypothetical protein